MSQPTALFVVEHCTDPESSRWRLVYVPAIGQYTQARDSGEIELMALELISLSTGIPIERLGVSEYRVHIPTVVRNQP